MPLDRIAEALRPTGRSAPVVELVAPAPAADPADALADLLVSPDTGELTQAEKNKLVELDRWKRAKTNHETAAKVLARDIAKREAELIELAVEKQLYDAKGRLALPDVEDGQGFELHPFDRTMIWPKYRIDPETDQPYGPEDVVEALRACDLGHLIVEKTEQYAYPGYIRERVKMWEQRCGQAGIRDADGIYLDLDGEPISLEEARDPIANHLALPAKLRAIVEPSPSTTIQFTRRQKASAAVAAVDAVETAGADAE